MTQTSASLLMRLRELGDREAWALFVKLYGPLIFKWARHVGLNAEDASDLVQDVMALLVRKLPAFRYDQSLKFRSWLKTVTINKWREQCRRKKLPMSNTTASGLARLPDNHEQDDFWQSEYRKQVIATSMKLMESEFPPLTWQACRRYVFDQESPDALAQELGISVWTIYTAKSRLIKRLREELDGMLD